MIDDEETGREAYVLGAGPAGPSPYEEHRYTVDPDVPAACLVCGLPRRNQRHPREA